MWEYVWCRVPDLDFPRTIEYLNRSGEDGWEFTGHTQDTGQSIDYLMKRLRKDDDETRHIHDGGTTASYRADGQSSRD